MSVVPTRYWHGLEDGRVQCDLCPRFCHLHEGQRGMCFVRACQSGEVVLASYGRSSGFCIDPVEKKPLNHFLPGTPVLSFGTAGCNLSCQFCQNWDISKSRETDVLADLASPELIATVARESGCRSVAFTYNDPVVFHEYAIDVAAACHERNLRAVAVTAGYVCPGPRAEFYRHMDAANVDLKALSDDFYRQVCAAHLDPVLDTLRYLRYETSVWLEVTNLLIPGRNDSDRQIGALAEWVVRELGPGVPLHFSAFHPAWRMLDTTPTPASTVRRARGIALRHGLRYVYTGNIHDPDGQSTSCHACDATLIGRDGYEITGWDLDASGRCLACATPLPGVFEPAPGHWGSRRVPVRMRGGERAQAAANLDEAEGAPPPEGLPGSCP